MSRDPIRVLHVVTYMGRGGLETMLMNYYRHIDRSKVQFDFLVHREFEADYDPEIISLGGRIFRLPRLVPWSGSYRNALKVFFDTHQEYKIIHVHQDCLSSIILKSAKEHRVPVRIGHSHTNNQDKNFKYLIKLFYKRRIPGNSTQLFACSKEAGDWMFDGAPYQILKNAIETSKYVYNSRVRVHMRKQLGIPDGAFVLGHVGRFHPQKNHAHLINIFAELKKIKQNSILLLVGDGDLRSSIEGRIANLGLSDSVIFTGVRDDVPDLMQAMDCFILPSVYEGLGIVAIEAQASGLPCILSDGVPEECDITSLTEHVALKEAPSVWAERILGHTKKTRLDTTKEIIRAGYDIGENAQWLQNYYLEQWKKEA